ncbi:MAG: hypothetical protein R3C45_13510 [Phycisphaerales bacterium]
MPRTANISRKTNETDIKVELNLDPAKTGDYSNKTGVGFFDHMLDHVARHGKFGLNVSATGDTHIDDHHTVEDVGIVLGQALEKALGDKKGIERYGFASVPMDEDSARQHRPVRTGGARIRCHVQGFVRQDRHVRQPARTRVLQCGGERRAVQLPHRGAPRRERPPHRRGDLQGLRPGGCQAVNVTGDDVPSTKGSL